MSLSDSVKERLTALFRATIAQLDPARRVREALGELAWSAEEVVIVAVGKAATTMANGAMEHWLAEARPAGAMRGLVIAPPGGPVARPGLTVMTASHPVPDQQSVAAAQAAKDAVSGAGDAGILVLVSGGASSLMALPAPGISLADKVDTVNAVVASGADILAINTVRKHLSAIKGGRLAETAPAPITTLVTSDVIGDDVATVGSGPTVPDPTTYRQACDIVASGVGWNSVPRSVRDHLELGASGQWPETPSVERPGDRVLLIAGTGALIDAARDSAAQTGMVTRVFARDIDENVADVASRVSAQVHRLSAAQPPQPHCLIGGGEPTIALARSPGRGGRAQHLALLVARDIAGIDNVSVLVAGSDGMDGSGHAAGAIVDGTTWQGISRKGIDPVSALDQCDSHTALHAVGADLITGPTGVNHADLIVIMGG